ncbi:MAG: C4-dicarboxylate ABC transporter, partial [Giesbergeria sp.]|nr:C4-dicarboxylate ABC transporter [Giesbergeria sp.]
TTLFVVAMNKAKYESLTPELKKVVDKHSGRDLSVWMGKILGDNDVPGKDKFIAAKNTVNVISAAELEKWKQASSRIDDEWIATVAKKGADGNALLADARALIQKHTAAAK